MPRSKKIEGSRLEQEIIDYALQGYSNNWIAKHCEAKGLSLDHRTVGRFLDRNSVKTSGKAVPYDKTLHNEDTEEEVLKPVIVNVEKLFKSFNINKNSDDIDDVISAVQKLSYEIFCLESAIVLERLRSHALGEGKHPNEHFRGYRIAFEVLQSALGYENAVNISQAVKTLESQGYQIQGLKLVEKSGQTFKAS